jgi:hypothetical protein
MREKDISIEGEKKYIREESHTTTMIILINNLFNEIQQHE